ncbi:hypothetical protein BOTBODRAFT_63341 [Botryobasidium botryosum FD-172 SS1]|uniref:Rho-GAP domain-containing protein n=1 Tax=Botryobasidium botryosum (strain FD-172 SS1) TaxID=930990 RepID=A0A067N2K5_BOTB1|nr:hypothetical protein BOTBODRAFT_63341 [Botryobasidium botryosum FD-172 SS1]
MSSVKFSFLPAEHVQCSAQIALLNNARRLSGGPPRSASDKETDRNRTLCVVTHMHDGVEQGGVFIFKTRADNSQLEIDHVFPILSDFVVEIAQIGAEDGAAEVPSLDAPSDSSLVVAMNGTEDGLSFTSPDIDALRGVVSESKRLRALAEKHGLEGLSPSHSWLRHYSPQSPGEWEILDEDEPAEVISDAFYESQLRKHHPNEKLSDAAAGHAGEEDRDERIIREDWIRAHTTARRAEYSTTTSLSVRLGTFNVNGNMPSGDISSWVHSKQPAYPDIFAFGFQELDRSTEALIYGSTTLREDSWYNAVCDALGDESDQYEKLASRQLVGILLVVLVRKTLRRDITSVSTCAAGVGLLNTMGNKGAVAVRLRLRMRAEPPSPSSPLSNKSPKIKKKKASTSTTTLCFVNCHLAASDPMVEKRNADYAELVRRLKFDMTAQEREDARVGRGGAIQTAGHGVFDCDHLFWVVNLNYRIDLPDTEVRELLEEAIGMGSKDFSTLLEYDQLRVSRSKGRCFHEFKEGTINFPPTYRYVIGEEDKQVFDPRRRPAWTDRIQFWSRDESVVEQVSYERHAKIVLSDHKPVSAEYKVEILNCDMGKLRKVYDEVSERLDSIRDTEAVFKVALSPGQLDFGTVSHLSRQEHTIDVRNTGKDYCAFRFLPKAIGELSHPSWLSIDPSSGIILPGETQTIKFALFIDDKAARDLNASDGSLSEILILHLEHGKDHFIPLTGTFRPTCMFNSLAKLVRLPGPIRGPGDPTQNPLLGESQARNAPTELMRVVDWLMQYSLNVDELFLSPGDPDVVEKIVEYLDTGEDFVFALLGSDATADGAPPDERVVLSFGETLVQFLQSLTEPVIPWGFHARCAAAVDREACLEIVAELPPASANVLLSVTAFLHFICQRNPVHGGSGRNRAELIANIFAPILLRDDDSLDPAARKITPLGKRKFLMNFVGEELSN